MLAFLDPKSTVKFSENFTIQADGTAVNTLLATCIACLIAPLMNLIPYPMTIAFNGMKGSAVKASKDTAKLFDAVIAYYNEKEYSVVIESELKHSVDLRAGMLNNVYDRLRALLVAVSTEDFGDSHIKIMDKIGSSSFAVSRTVAKLLITATEAATDGDISDQEKDQLRGLVAETKEAVKQLAVDFDGARRAYKPASKDTFGE